MQFDRLRRREFLTLIGSGAVAAPLRAQQPNVPLIGFLAGASPDAYSPYTAVFLQGLNETGYVERSEQKWYAAQVAALAMAARYRKRPAGDILRI
jgi:putative ABC transport system substrate-binding protein